MKNIQSFFDKHSQHHNYSKDPGFYVQIMELVRDTDRKRDNSLPMQILDLGCGNGSFLSRLIQEGLRGKFLGIDLSSSMIKLSKINIKDNEQDVDLLVASGLDIPVKEEIKFDLVHIDSVLHHLVSKTRTLSTSLAAKMISTLIGSVSSQGIVIIEEMYYNSYLLPQISSTAIFYGLKLLNTMHLDLSRLSDEVVLGLEVNFFEETQLFNLLSLFGQVKVIRKNPIYVAKYKKLFFLREFGHISYVLSPNIKNIEQN